MPKKILIVEDERDVVKLLRYNLEKEGFRVNSVTDGSLALAELRRDGADLVILDLMLPGMDGLEVCRQLRRAAKRPTGSSGSNSAQTTTSQNLSVCAK